MTSSFPANHFTYGLNVAVDGLYLLLSGDEFTDEEEEHVESVFTTIEKKFNSRGNVGGFIEPVMELSYKVHNISEDELFTCLGDFPEFFRDKAFELDNRW